MRNIFGESSSYALNPNVACRAMYPADYHGTFKYLRRVTGRAQRLPYCLVNYGHAPSGMSDKELIDANSPG